MTKYFDIDFDTVLSGTVKGSDMPARPITWDKLSNKLEYDVQIAVLTQLAISGQAEFKLGLHTMCVRLLTN